MEINEIVSRNTGSNYTVDEMSYVVEQYIKEKKGVEVNINLEKNINTSTQHGQFAYLSQVSSLDNAFSYACKYFLRKAWWLIVNFRL